MVTRGDVSLDVEDNRGPYDWPQLNEITADLLQFSVHLPLDPSQNPRWPGGEPSRTVTDGGVVRVLNIIVDESRILSSRERCPFLVHVEVAETGLSGTDSRLYATGAAGLGATVGEALAMTAGRANDKKVMGASYEIPGELLDATNIPIPSMADPTNIPIPSTTDPSQQTTIAQTEQGVEHSNVSRAEYVRGGYQGDENVFYTHNAEGIWGSDAWDDVRQREYEQLHQQMYVEQQTNPSYYQQQQQPVQQR